MSSAEAAVAIVNELPADALLFSIRANPAGYLNHDGLDTRWIAVAQTTSGESAWSAGVGMEDGELLVTLSEREPLDCAATPLPLHEVDSAVVVPETVSRVNALSSLRPVKALLVYYWQQAPCFAEMFGDAPTGHLVMVTRQGSDWQDFFYAHFDDSAQLVWLCGPCESAPIQNCQACAP